MKQKISLLLLVLLTSALLFACGKDQQPPDLNTYIVGTTNSSTAAGVVVSTGPVEAKPEEITVEEYDQLIVKETTYEEAVAIIGSEGTPMAKRGNTTPYQWKGFAPMSKTVEMNFNADGLLVSKDPKGSNLAVAK